MPDDSLGIAIKVSSTVDKFHEGEAKPFEVSTVKGVWTNPDGTPVTDPDRLARLEQSTMAKLTEGQKVIITRDDGTETHGTMLRPDLADDVVQVADENGLPRSVPASWVKAAPAEKDEE